MYWEARFEIANVSHKFRPTCGTVPRDSFGVKSTVFIRVSPSARKRKIIHPFKKLNALISELATKYSIQNRDWEAVMLHQQAQKRSHKIWLLEFFPILFNFKPMSVLLNPFLKRFKLNAILSCFLNIEAVTGHFF
jgi:hypothetical protein